MNNLFFLNPAEDFSETLLIGNGHLGAILYGGVDEDVYEFNDDTLWSGYPRKYPKNSNEDFEAAKKAVLSGDLQAGEKRLERVFGKWSQCYLPAGTLKVKASYGEYSEYRRNLTLDNALHTVTFRKDSNKYKRTAYASHIDDVICIRYECEQCLPSLEISLVSGLRSSVSFEDQTLFLSGEAPGDGIPSYIKVDKRLLYSEKPEEKGMLYTVALRTNTDGTVVFENEVLTVCCATYLEIYVTIRTSFNGYDHHPHLDGINSKAEAIKVLDKACANSYEVLLARHTEDFSALYNRVSFELCGGCPDLPIDERLKKHQEEPDNGLYALFYQFGRYLMISSSRPGTQPTNLQGIWNNKLSAPWSCNYTVNINTEMNYWGACGANLAECCEPLNRMIFELSDAGKETAKLIYKADGFCVHHNVDIWRMTHPVGDWGQNNSNWAYFPLAGAWLTRHLYEYYLETNDVAFLGGKAFEAILGSAKFCDSMLTEKDGNLIFSPAASPENQHLFNGEGISISEKSAMFQSIVRDAFEICIECCNILGREKEYAEYLKERLVDIPWLEIGSDGRILEWDTEREEKNIKHRHLSHLYSFYPAKKITSNELFEACKKTLEVRGDISNGWSSAWKISLWAVLGDGNRALDLVNQLLVDARAENRGGTYPNLLCACPPFQIDGNFGILAGIQEMLIGEKEGKIVLLPSLPDAWKDGKITGLRYHGHTINMEWRDGKIISSTID